MKTWVRGEIVGGGCVGDDDDDDGGGVGVGGLSKGSKQIRMVLASRTKWK